MPCGNLDHGHPLWPQQGAHEFVIEACENHCGWCRYQTKTANNLRVHARRHLTNENETRLRRIKIVKGKAGRKKVQMAKRRPPGPEVPDEKPYRSPSAELLNMGINADQPGNDLDESSSRDQPNEAFHPLPPAATEHTQGPHQLLHSQYENSLLCRSPIMQIEHPKLPLSNASMEILSPSKTSRTQSHCQRILDENGAGDAGFLGLSLSAKSNIKRLILEPLVLSSHELDLSHYCGKMVSATEIICLRDLEKDLLNVPNTVSWKTVDEKIGFALLVIRCIKNTLPFLDHHELVRPTDQPYNDRYFTELESSLETRYQLPEMVRDKEIGFNREVRQEQREKLPYSIDTLDGADTRVGDIPMIPDHRLGERRGPKERDTNESLSDIAEGRSWTSSNLRSIQKAAHLPRDSTQNGTSQHLNPGLPGPLRSSLKDLGYSETEIDEISTGFNINIRQHHRKTQALNCIHKEILLPLLRRPSLQEWKCCIGAKSPTSYLRFCNYLVRCIQILISEDGSLNDEEKTCRDQSTYSEAYFTELSERIHNEADRKWHLELPAGKAWSCPESQCFLRHESTFKISLVVHLPEYHNEDVGCTSEEELAGRDLRSGIWRCWNCLCKNCVPQSGYVCSACRVPCEEFRIKARAKLDSRENGMSTFQQGLSPAYASTIVPSQSIGRRETSSLDTPMESASQTLQPHLSLPEPVTSHRDASNAALELPESTPAIEPTISDNRHQGGIVGANQSSGSYVPDISSFVWDGIVASMPVPLLNLGFILKQTTTLQ